MSVLKQPLKSSVLSPASFQLDKTLRGEVITVVDPWSQALALSNWKQVKLKILDFSDHMRTGSSNLTSVADKFFILS